MGENLRVIGYNSYRIIIIIYSNLQKDSGQVYFWGSVVIQCLDGYLKVAGIFRWPCQPILQLGYLWDTPQLYHM